MHSKTTPRYASTVLRNSKKLEKTQRNSKKLEETQRNSETTSICIETNIEHAKTNLIHA
jgi:hypothetical protein